MADWANLKPILTALILPPVPFLLLAVIGAVLLWRRRGGAGGAALSMAVVGIWLCSCSGTAHWLLVHALHPPPALDSADRHRLAAMVAARQASHAPVSEGSKNEAAQPPAAIIVLGSGREPLAEEYGGPDLPAHSVARLRYGIWLSRQTGVPLGFSGGVGWGEKRGGTSVDAAGGDAQISEAEVASRVAREHFGVRLRWIESGSADTRGNADATMAIMAREGIREVVVVTQAYHMPRALRNFERAASQEARRYGAAPIRVTAAPMDFWHAGERSVLDWLPSPDGMSNVRVALKEWAGLLAGG